MGMKSGRSAILVTYWKIARQIESSGDVLGDAHYPVDGGKDDHHPWYKDCVRTKNHKCQSTTLQLAIFEI